MRLNYHSAYFRTLGWGFTSRLSSFNESESQNLKYFYLAQILWGKSRNPGWFRADLFSSPSLWAQKDDMNTEDACVTVENELLMTLHSSKLKEGHLSLATVCSSESGLMQLFWWEQTLNPEGQSTVWCREKTCDVKPSLSVTDNLNRWCRVA